MKKHLSILECGNSFRIFFFLTPLLFVNLFTGLGQANSVDSVVPAAFNRYKAAYIQEKLFAHTDKGMYTTGEICWFRLYYVNAVFGGPESLSKIAYVELLDKNNLNVLQEKISLKPKEAAGSMVIPVGLPSGVYRFRAYTSWMKNFEPEYFFEKPLRIINPRDLSRDSAASKSMRYDIQFFPEGGNLVQNLNAKVAFRIVDEYGKGMDCSGELLNSTGDTILHFRPLHFGLGSFHFTPLEGQHYKAVIRFQNGDRAVQQLPDAYPTGYSMHVFKSEEGPIAVEIQVSPDLDGQHVYLFVHGSQANLPVKREITLKQKAVFFIKPEELEDGISRFTLFDKNSQPVCERLYFKYPEKKLQIETEINMEYGIRKKIDLHLSARDATGNPVDADMSMAVYLLDSLQEVDPTDIRYYLYLESELGAIENPSFYFDSTLAREEDMNNLLMTHGWRRFKWKNLLNPSPMDFEFPPEMFGHIFHGKLIGGKGMPVSRIATYLSVPSTRTQFRTTYSDEEGNIKFELPDFYGSEEIVVQTGPGSDSSLHIEMTSPFSQKFSNSVLPEYIAPDKNSRSLLYRSVRGQVQRVYDGQQLNRFSQQMVDTNSFYVVPDESYLLDNYTRFLTMEEVLREYVQFASVSKKNDKFQLILADKPRVNAFHEPPLILIDGVPFFDADKLFHQDPKMIKRIELVNRQYALGNMTFEGIVNVTTYQGDLNGIVMDPHATILEYPGMQEEREFFSPVYDTEDQINSRMPDFRTLLSWAPQMKPGTFSFYTSDLPGKYVLVVQGLTKQGVPGGNMVYFNVVK